MKYLMSLKKQYVVLSIQDCCLLLHLTIEASYEPVFLHIILANVYKLAASKHLIR